MYYNNNSNDNHDGFNDKRGEGLLNRRKGGTVWRWILGGWVFGVLSALSVSYVQKQVGEGGGSQSLTGCEIESIRIDHGSFKVFNEHRSDEECRNCTCSKGSIFCSACGLSLSNEQSDSKTQMLPDNDSFVVDDEYDNLKLLCLIAVKHPYPKSLDIIIRSWGRTCDKLLFTSAEGDAQRGVVKLNIVQGKNLWGIIHPAYTFVWENLIKEKGEYYDWIIKLDDDSYFVAKNFIHAVRQHKYRASEPHYLGSENFYYGIPNVFHAGAGYILSYRALELVAPTLPSSKNYNHSLENKKSWTRRCINERSWAEDLFMSRCLRGVNITADNFRDADLRERVLVFHVRDHLEYVRRKDSTGWFWQNKINSIPHGGNCCSSRTVVFHNFKDELYQSIPQLHFFFEHLEIDPLVLFTNLTEN